MGEILQGLIETRARLQQKKTYLQGASQEITAINARIARLNTIITAIEQQGWDA